MEIYRKKRKILLFAFIILLFTAVLSISIGRYPISIGNIIKLFLNKLGFNFSLIKDEESVLFALRLPRIIAGIIIGAGLAISGATYQALFRNPMVSPDILGASQSAGFGAALAILTGQNFYYITASSFFFGILGVLICFLISLKFKTNRILALILGGILVGSLFSSLTSYLKLIADDENMLPQITYWLMGSLASIRMFEVKFIFFTIFIPSIALLFIRWRINLFTLSEDESISVGVNIRMLRICAILLSTLITAGAVSVSGVIGWVGLVVPHISRRIIGDDNRFLIPLSFFVGACFLLISDTLARSLSTLEFPIGIVTSVIGVPIFMIILLYIRRE